jgi:Ca2+-binding EF-hand superfamily protein
MKPLIITLSFVFSAHMLCAALPGAESLAKLIAHEFDTNSDGILDQGEWQGGIARSFDQLDKNHDDAIKPEEVDALSGDLAEEAGEIGGTILVVLIKQALLTLDQDGDKAVSRKEFDALTEGIFTKLDADKNGSLTLAELSDLPVKMVMK